MEESEEEQEEEEQQQQNQEEMRESKVGGIGRGGGKDSEGDGREWNNRWTQEGGSWRVSVSCLTYQEQMGREGQQRRPEERGISRSPTVQ